MGETHLYIHQPTNIFKARVNMAGAITYPISEITFDGVTVGAYTNVLADMTLLLGSSDGADDLGRTRVWAAATTDAIPIMITSQGVEDGELTIVDNAYITVLSDYRVWSKIPDIDDDGIQYKDTSLAVGTYTSGDEPPVANCGPGFAGFVDDDDVITVEFDASHSVAIADGATIVSYAWELEDGSVVAGDIDEVSVTAEFTNGFRWVQLTVTDSNGSTHTAYCPVLAVFPGLTTLQTGYTAETTITPSGQTMRFVFKEEIPRSTYRDGALILFWEGEAANPSDRSHMQFIGWEQSNDNESRSGRTGPVAGTVINAVDVAGRLALLPGFPQSLERHATPDNWDKMVNPTMDKYIHYLLQWHSTALSLADYTPSGTGDDYQFVIFASEGESLWEQVNSEAKGMVPGYLLTCDIQGRLAVVPDPMLQNNGARTATVQAAFDEEYLAGIRFSYTRPPKVHWLRGHALLTATGYTDVEGVPTLLTVHCIAPGVSPGQGINEVVQSEGLARSQSALNSAKGHEYARLNSRYGPITVSPADDDPYLEVQPAHGTWVTLTVTAATAAQRGLTFSTTRCLVKEIRRRWDGRRTGTIRHSEFTLEVETSGTTAVTTIPADSPPAAPFEPPDLDDPDFLYGDMAAYILWDGNEVVRTWNLQDSSPVWEEITGALTGNVHDLQYMMVAAEQVGVWALTSAGVFFCEDIMAASPAWVEKLSLATVQGIAVAPEEGEVIFAGMTHFWLQPGHLCVSLTLDEENDSYQHAYFWVTEDYGATWTPVDMNTYTFGIDPNVRCYYFTGIYSIACFRSEPIIWCVRSNGRTGTSSGDGAVFKSEDGGYTWTKEETFLGGRVGGFGSILNPYPDETDPIWVQIAIGGTTPVGQIHVSVDGLGAATQRPEPAGHSGGFGFPHMQRVNKNPFVADHVLALFTIDASSNADLYDSTDQGANWNFIRGLNNSMIAPNGWPPDPDQWVLIDNTDTPHIQLTLDYFDTLLDKTGNLAAVITWTAGQMGGGFALPRVGLNS